MAASSADRPRSTLDGRVADSAELRALYGLWLYDILICQYRAAGQEAERFQRVAETETSAGEVPTADRMMAMVLHYLGDQTGTRACAERSLAAPAPANRYAHSARYGLDQRVGAQVQLARALWLLGRPEQAWQVAQSAISEAAAVGHANSMCLALADGACIVALLSGNLAEAERFAASLDEYADRHALGVWRTYGHALRGRLLVQHGRALDGAALLRSALGDLHDTPSDIRFQLYLVWLAEVLEAAGQAAEALAAVTEALERAERTEERWYLPELLRLRGEILLRLDPLRFAAEARDCLARSLGMAQGQEVLAWELRTTMSLVRLRRGETSDAALHAMLAGVVGRFSEGFATTDLVAAQRLLDTLRP